MSGYTSNNKGLFEVTSTGFLYALMRLRYLIIGGHHIRFQSLCGCRRDDA